VSAVVLAVSLPAVLGVAGLAVDAGLWYNDTRTLQGVADLAAWTAMQTYFHESETSTAISDAKIAAQAVAATNGFANGSKGLTVTVNNPPASGPNKGVTGAFEVIIAKPESLFFSSAYLRSVTVRGRAVAAVTTSTTGNGAPGCILSLTTITLDGNADVGAPTCSVYANGSGTGAISLTGNAELTASDVSVVGGITTSGNATVSNPQVKGATPVANPYASDTVAAAEAGSGTTCSSSDLTDGGNGTFTLSPGVYCGGLTLTANAAVTLQPGIYIIQGGSLTISGNTTVTGTGVTFVLTGSGSTASITGNSKLNLSAPTGGPTAGLVFFGDPANTAAVSFSGNGTLEINGAIYFPSQSVSFEGNTSNASGCTQLVAFAITFTGNADFGQNCGNSGTQQIGGTKTTVSMSMLE
jgi:hypothetical protein